MHFFAGVEGSVHDLEVFRRTINNLYRLLEDHPNEPTKIFADKGYIGFNDSLLVKLVTPHKKLPHRFLSDAQVRSNQRLSSARVVVENYFGRLATRFHIVVRRWGFDDAFYDKDGGLFDKSGGLFETVIVSNFSSTERLLKRTEFR
jgi:hypothetical protein